MKWMQRWGLLYPAALVVFLLGLLFWFLNRYEFSVQVEATPPPAIPRPEPPVAPVAPSQVSASPASPRLQPAPAGSPSPASRTTPTAALPAHSATRPGQLRVGNPTEHPLRLALLRQLPPKSAARAAGFDQPLHWDFAPQEGGRSGLLLSLPTGKLEIREGDVLVAFAQDGSGRYWGPYVVGETPGLGWSDQRREWLLILQP